MVSVGELIDRYSILQIKSKKITDIDKLAKIDDEKQGLLRLVSEYVINPVIGDLYEDLIGVNLQLWEVEDKLRDFERQGKFDEEFVSCARSVYILNDQRHQLKTKINLMTNSPNEVKQYTEYK